MSGSLYKMFYTVDRSALSDRRFVGAFCVRANCQHRFELADAVYEIKYQNDDDGAEKES